MERAWIYKSDRDSARNFEFRLDNMFRQQATDIIEAMITSAETIITNDCFHFCLCEILHIDRSIFKDVSQYGVVFIDKRWKDLGNYQYTFLYQFLFRVARGRRNHLLPLMQELAQRYPTLAFRALPTALSLSMKGDVIEFALSVARETGPAIAPETTLPRIEFCGAVVAFARKFEDLRRIICVNENGPPLMRYFPPPDVLVKVCLYAYYRMKDDPQYWTFYMEQYDSLKAGIECFRDWTYQESSGVLIPFSRC